MHFHQLRDALLAEVHARPSTPVEPPMLVTRVAALSGQAGAEADRNHMVALCRRFAQAEPAPGMRWCALDAGSWQLRWERHSEFSSWTFQRRPSGRDGPEDALAGVPGDWLAALPGPVLVLTTIELGDGAGEPAAAPGPRHEAIGVRLLGGAATLETDLRPDRSGMTRFRLDMAVVDPVLAGRLVLSVLEIETYRLMALLAFPVAGEAAAELRELEAEAEALAARLADDLGVEDDRALLTRLVALSGRVEALGARTNFRFAAGRAYHSIVLDRIASLQEEPLPGLQTVGGFMERRLAPAMRTCQSVAEREAAALARIGRAGQMLNTRIELVTQAINAELLASMDRRASAQLRLQRTVEGLSVAAISYYLVALLSYGFTAAGEAWPAFDPTLAAALAAPLVVLAVWLTIARIRRSIDRDLDGRQHRTPERPA